MVPPSFQTQRALKLLNVAAVGFALASVVGAVTAVATRDATSLVTALPTWILGTVWAWVLRVPKTVGNTTFRWGWVASMPLAILNSSLAAGLLFGSSLGNATQFNPSEFLLGAVLGATFGSFVWAPALVATLLCFGLPIAWAQRLAKKGLAGEERGEWIVGLVCVAMSVLGLLIPLAAPTRTSPSGFAGEWTTLGLALMGVLTGALSTTLALAREARRRRFVAAAEAGTLEGYRVDATDEGKVLVRVVALGKGYRVADFEEEVFELDAAGEATRAKHLDGAAARP